MTEPPGYGLQADQSLQHQHSLSYLSIQTIAMLSRSQADVDAVLAANLADNPALVATQPRRCRECAGALRNGRCTICAGRTASVTEPAAVLDPLDQLRRDARLQMPDPLEPLVDAVLGWLDDRGLLTVEPSQLRRALGCGPGELATVLTALEQVGPPGIAAPDTATCLLRQARWHAERGGPALLPVILSDHLDIVAAGDLDRLAIALHADRGEVENAVAFLRARLTPAPLPRSDRHETASMPPDVIIERVGDELRVVVLSTVDLGLSLDPGGLDLGVSPAALQWWSERLSTAKDLLAVIDRRAGTLRRIAGALIELQRNFILNGPAAHLPLTRVELAQHLGLHPSTVSRATRHTTARMPDRSLIPLADFFGAATSAKAALARLLDSRRPPRTDSEAAERLTAAGFTIARRTVAKYRHELSAGG